MLANFGSSSSAKTVDIKGVVNNGTLSATLYNHNKHLQRDLILWGILILLQLNWNSATGWIRTNIDNAVYYFNAAPRISIPALTAVISMAFRVMVLQEILSLLHKVFFVHVTDGSFPVTAQLGVNNNARTNDLSPLFHNFSGQLLRVSAGFC